MSNFVLSRKLEPSHYTTLHYTTLPYPTLQYTTLHDTTLPYTPLHYTTPGLWGVDLRSLLADARLLLAALDRPHTLPLRAARHTDSTDRLVATLGTTTPTM